MHGAVQVSGGVGLAKQGGVGRPSRSGPDVGLFDMLPAGYSAPFSLSPTPRFAPDTRVSIRPLCVLFSNSSFFFF